jgi:hypothetical protein
LHVPVLDIFDRHAIDVTDIPNDDFMSHIRESFAKCFRNSLLDDQRIRFEKGNARC